MSASVDSRTKLSPVRTSQAYNLHTLRVVLQVSDRQRLTETVRDRYRDSQRPSETHRDPHVINSQRPSETVSDRYRDRWFFGTDRQRP